MKLLRESRTVKLDYITPQPAVTYPIFHSTIFDFQSIKRRVLLGVKKWRRMIDGHHRPPRISELISTGTIPCSTVQQILIIWMFGAERCVQRSSSVFLNPKTSSLAHNNNMLSASSKLVYHANKISSSSSCHLLGHVSRWCLMSPLQWYF